MRERTIFFIFLGIMLMGANLSATSIEVGGSILSDTTWCADTIFVVNEVFIPNSVKVTICPGTVVMHTSPGRLNGEQDLGI